MTSDIFGNLEALRLFLAQEVAGQVSPQLRGEVRAMSKLLGDIAQEFNALPALLFSECQAMSALCEQAVAATPKLVTQMIAANALQQMAWPMGSLSDQIRLHDALTADLQLVLTDAMEMFDKSSRESAEQSAFGTRILAIYRLLADQADARLRWQSVFPALANPSTRKDGI